MIYRNLDLLVDVGDDFAHVLPENEHNVIT